jgi:hypothetical protein
MNFGHIGHSFDDFTPGQRFDEGRVDEVILATLDWVVTTGSGDLGALRRSMGQLFSIAEQPRETQVVGYARKPCPKRRLGCIRERVRPWVGRASREHRAIVASGARTAGNDGRKRGPDRNDGRKVTLSVTVAPLRLGSCSVTRNTDRKCLHRAATQHRLHRARGRRRPRLCRLSGRHFPSSPANISH